MNIFWKVSFCTNDVEFPSDSTKVALAKFPASRKTLCTRILWNQKLQHLVRFEVLTVMTITITGFCGVTICGSVDTFQRFRRTCAKLHGVTYHKTVTLFHSIRNILVLDLTQSTYSHLTCLLFVLILSSLILRSRYSDWLRAWSSSPGRVKDFLFSTSSRPVLGPTQPPIQ
jgi:hypothetical protein